MDLLQLLNWRYATKRMDGSVVPEEKVNNILETIRLSASSMGLQPYTVLVIKDAVLRKKIRLIANNQPQIEECSHLLVFAVWDTISEKQVEAHIENIAKTRNVPIETQNEYKLRLLKIVKKNSKEQNFNWAARQVYIAFGTALIAAAAEQVDATPMEGFDNSELDKLLKLKELGLKSVTIMPLGYRDNETDWLVKFPKVRRDKNKLFINL